MKTFYLAVRSDCNDLVRHLADSALSRNQRDQGIELTVFGAYTGHPGFYRFGSPSYEGEPTFLPVRLRATRRLLRRGFQGLKFRPDGRGGFNVRNVAGSYLATLETVGGSHHVR